MRSKNEILNLGIVEGSTIIFHYLGMEVFGIFKEVNNEKIVLVESIIRKTDVQHNVNVKFPSIKLNQEFLLEGINYILNIDIDSYKSILNDLNLNSLNIDNYLNSNLIISYMNDKNNLNNIIISKFGVKFKVKTNLAKANWVSIVAIPEQQTFMLELTSEYFDKASKSVISNTKMLEYVDSLEEVSKKLSLVCLTF